MKPMIANSSESLQRSIGTLRELWGEHHFLRITARTGKDRSLSQNDISHVWYAQISRELKEDSAMGVKCECKLRFGVPILRADDPDFREIYDAGIKRLDYQQKLKAMEYIPVTSIMTKRQLSEYLVQMQNHYALRHVVLEFPAEDSA